MMALFARLVLALLRQISDLVAENPTDRADRGQIEFITHAVGEQSVSNLPCENARVPLLVSPNVLDYGRGRDPWLTTADCAGEYRAGLVVPGQNLAHAAMRDAELPADVARPDAQLGQLYYPESDGIGQGSSVHKNTSQLVHLAKGWL